MKLEALETVTETNCALESKEFTIKSSPIAFDILSSKLYSNNILAIVRELLTNAYDSQVANGTQNTPIDVTVPTYNNPNFIIRDYGIGLTAEEVNTIYTSFFTSTKTNSNDFTGCFGLGSKTPFSYTQSFTVTTYKDGKQYLYLATKKDGFPSILKLNESNTNEPNGLKIIIPVNNNALDDQRKFKIELENFLKFVPEIKINCINFNLNSLPEKEFSIDNIDFYYQKGYNYNNSNKIYIKQGQNVYDVTDKFTEEGYKNDYFFQSLLSYFYVVINVPIGSYRITPSRENLIYDDATNEKLNELKVFIHKFIVEMVSKDTDLKYAAYGLFSDIYTKRINTMYFNDEKVVRSIDNKNITFNNYSSNTFYALNYVYIYTTEFHRLSFFKANTNYTIIMGCPLGSEKTRKLKQKLRAITNEHNIDFNNCLFIPDKEGFHLLTGEFNEVTFNTYLKKLNNFLFIVSNMGYLNITFTFTSFKEIQKQYPVTKVKKVKVINNTNTTTYVASTPNKNIRITRCGNRLVEDEDYPYWHNNMLYNTTNSITSINQYDRTTNFLFITQFTKDKMATVFNLMLDVKNKDNKYIFRDYLINKYDLSPTFFSDYLGFDLIGICNSNLKYLNNFKVMNLDIDLEWLFNQQWKIFSNNVSVIKSMHYVDGYLKDHYNDNQINIITKSISYQKYKVISNYIEKYNGYISCRDKYANNTLREIVCDFFKIDYLKFRKEKVIYTHDFIDNIKQRCDRNTLGFIEFFRNVTIKRRHFKAKNNVYIETSNYTNFYTKANKLFNIITRGEM